MRLIAYYFVTVLTVNAQTGRGVNFYTTEKEAALGASLVKDMRQRVTPVESVAVRGYVNKIGRQLATQFPIVGFTYTFDVIAEDLGGLTHEPLSFPGGYIFVSADLIRTAQTEAEFAGMLAHAMAHAAARHATRLATRGEIANRASIPLIFMGSWTGLGAGDDQIVPIGFRSAQRQFENEADVLAIQTMAGAGFDPAALVSYIRRVQTAEADPQRVSKLFSSLPSRDSRISNMENAIRELPQRTYAPSDEFQLIQNEVRR